MKFRTAPLCVMAALVAASHATSQAASVTSSARTTYAQAFGFDYEYNDGESASDAAPSATGEWITTTGVDLDDYWGIDVADASVYHESIVGGSELAALIDCSASTASNHFQEDSWSTSDFDVDFTVPAAGVRYRFEGEADSTYGYNMANVTLRDVATSTTVIALSGDYGDADDTQTTGWLPAGTYELRATCEAMAYGDHDDADSQSAHLEFSLRIYNACDMNYDGHVDVGDKLAFKAAWRAGDLAADMNRDAVVDLADGAAFEAEFRRHH